MVQAVQVSPVVRTQRQASPERWQNAAQRAIAEGISVRQVNASGMWVASSGTHANVAYVLEITGTLVQSCSCPAGTFGDPCCKHAARYYLDAGLLEIDDPEPEPPVGGATGTPLIVLGGWSFAHEGTEDDAVAVECAGCGDRIYVDDPSDDAYCVACEMPAAAVAALHMESTSATVACLFCGSPIYRGDADDAGNRHRWCGRLIARLNAARSLRREEPIAA